MNRECILGERVKTKSIPATEAINVITSLPYMPIDISKESPDNTIQAFAANKLTSKQVTTIPKKCQFESGEIKKSNTRRLRIS